MLVVVVVPGQLLCCGKGGMCECLVVLYTAEREVQNVGGGGEIG